VSDRESRTDAASPFPVSSSVLAATRAWTSASEHMLKSVTEANRAALAAFGVGNGEETDDAGRVVEWGVPSVAYSTSGWSFERSVERTDEIRVGDTVRFSKEVTEADVEAFADATGDTNRLHLDESFARDTRFGGRIAHGVLVLGLISAALARLPGLSIYLSQDVRFTSPAEIGRRYTAVVEVRERIDDDRFRLSTNVVDETGETVVDGEAVVLVDELPE
jgi:acyl dehydratase